MHYGTAELNRLMMSKEYLPEYQDRAIKEIKRVVGRIPTLEEYSEFAGAEYIVRALLKNADEEGINDSDYIAERIRDMFIKVIQIN